MCPDPGGETTSAVSMSTTYRVYTESQHLNSTRRESAHERRGWAGRLWNQGRRGNQPWALAFIVAIPADAAHGAGHAVLCGSCGTVWHGQYGGGGARRVHARKISLRIPGDRDSQAPWSPWKTPDGSSANMGVGVEDRYVQYFSSAIMRRSSASSPLECSAPKERRQCTL